MNLTGIAINLVEALAIYACIAQAPSTALDIILKAFKQPKDGKLRHFIRHELFYALLGIAISACFLRMVGRSQDQVIIDTVTSGFEMVERAAGLDEITLCRNRVNSEYGFTPEQFAEEASRFSIMGTTTLSEREAVLAEGNILLLFGGGASSLELLYSQSVTAFCEKRNAQ